MPLAPTRPRAPPSERTKMLLAAAIFLAIVGGWLGWQRWRDLTSPLPDVAAPTGECTIWFVGSSSIHKWRTLDQDMAPWDAHNRGVDGAMVPQLTRWLGNEPDTSPNPAAIVYYAGENDLARGVAVPQAVAEYRRFLVEARARMPGVPILTLSQKPSPTRWAMRPQQLAFNRAVRAIAAGTPGIHFVDTGPTLLCVL